MIVGIEIFLRLFLTTSSTKPHNTTGSMIQGGVAPTLQSQSGFSSQKHPFILNQHISARNPNRKNAHKGGSGLLTSSEKSFALETTQHFVNGVRKLMPIECERLMSFPDNWTKFGRDEKGNIIEISDSQRYKMCGNGVVSNIVKVLIQDLLF